MEENENRADIVITSDDVTEAAAAAEAAETALQAAADASMAAEFGDPSAQPVQEPAAAEPAAQNPASAPAQEPVPAQEPAAETASGATLETVPAAEPAGTDPAAEPAPGAEPVFLNPARNIPAEFKELTDAHPELQGRAIPDDIFEVMQRSDRSILAVYDSEMLKKASAKISMLEAELALLRQNADNAARAPVVGSTGAPAAEPVQEEQDPFLRGFNREFI